MLATILTWSAAALLLITAGGLLISRDWRVNLSLMAIQYVGMFLLVSQHWPFGLAAVKLVTGWMAAAALGITRLTLTERETATESGWPQGRLFRAFLIAIVMVMVVVATPAVEAVIPGISRPVVVGGLLLVGLGLVHLGISAEILRVILGLLTVLAGFEILYATIETSILLAGLLAVVNLGLALVGSYLMTASQAEGEAE